MKNHLTSILLACFGLFIPHLLTSQCNADEGEVLLTFQGDENADIDNSRWEIISGTGEILANGTSDAELCLPLADCYTFKVYDSFGDGLAGDTPGFYSLVYQGVQVAANIDYGLEEEAYFGGCTPGISCFSALAATTGEVYTVTSGESWYVFTPETAGFYELATCGFANSCNTAIWVYDRCLGLSGTLSQEETVFYNSNGCEGEQAVISGVFLAGTTYYFRLGGEDESCLKNSFQWQLTFNGEVMGCTDPLSCNYDPLATQDDGSCIYAPSPNCPAGPDLIVAPGVLANSIYSSTVGESGCYVNEGCLQGYGQRQVVRFTTHIKNVGTEDYVIGSPNPESGQFEYDECHGHWHYEGYAEYRLYDANGLALPVGFKNGFCVLDLECSGGGTPAYGCGYMGIAAGCGDIYGSGLNCQWIDVTELPEGFYTLVVVVNWDRDADLFGREEVTYDNNWDQVCFQLTRDGNNDHSINYIDSCPILTDCDDTLQGDAQPDCYGICGGDGKYGDLNVNTIYDAGDISMYINGILDSTIPVTDCTDLTNNDLVDLEDPAWLMDCILVENGSDNHQSHAHSCQLPTYGITNPNQVATFSLLEHHLEERYVVIGLENANVEMVATHLKMGGLVLENVELLASDYVAEVFFRSDGQIVTFSYAFDAATRNNVAQPFLKAYYSEMTGEGTCLEVYTTINQRIERVQGLVGDDNCLSDIEPCSPTEPLDSDDDGICDDVDVCPGGNDNFDADEDGVPDDCDACAGFDDTLDEDQDGTPDACDICPGIPDEDDDNDGVCNTEDICPNGDDNADADEDGTPDACDVCPGSAENDTDNDGVCDDVDLCIGVNDSLFCELYRLEILFDNYPEENSWDVRDTLGNVIVSHEQYPPDVEATMITETICLPSGVYIFSYYDSFGDGICCGYGIGEFQLIRDQTGEVIAQGSDFDNVSTAAFTASALMAADADGDGVCDPVDACPGQDDNLDTDGDGVPNGCDDCLGEGTIDSDNDTVCDAADVCPDGDDLADADEDGTPDACDDCPNSATGDTDLDGVCDDLDLCPGADDNMDADNDGTPDACDTCPNSATGDSDADGVCDDLDVCPGFDDALDADNDGQPDACDDCPNSATGDSDNDGVCDDLDICAGGDDTLDTDEDGTPDACDICPTLVDDIDVDEDGVCDNVDVCIGADDNIFCAEITLTIIFDDYPQETSWEMTDSEGEVMWIGGGFSSADDFTTQVFNICLPNGSYSFTIFDTANDGLCCAYGKGGYRIEYANTTTLIGDGADFGGSETTTFEMSNVSAPDEDQDGVCDPMDLCPGFDDAIDIDEDGIPDGCDDIVSGVEDIQAVVAIKSIAPNPTADQLKVSFTTPVNGTIVVYDLLGQPLRTCDIRQQGQQVLPLKNLVAGTYLLVFVDENGRRAVHRFVKL